MVETTRVLQVDDEPDFLDVSSKLLERAADDIEVVTAASGEAALERLAEGNVDCVVSDYDMPGMDGLELLREVRADSPSTPFILLTARGSETVASEAISAGVDDYLQKGGGKEQYQLLANRVRNLVRQTQAETSHREIFDNAAVGLTVRDKETGELVDANQRYCELLGYSKEKLLSLGFDEISATSEGYTAERALEHVREVGSGEVETFEWLDRTSDGECLWVEVSLRRAEIEGEERILASVQDITERKTREQQLAETRGYYETIAANLPGTVVLIYDPGLTYEFADGGAFDRLTVDAEELVGESVREFHSAAFVEEHLDEYEAALDGESRSVAFEFDERSVRGHTLPVADDEGDVIAGMVVGRDVTEIRELERWLEDVRDVLDEDFQPTLRAASDALERAVETDDSAALADARTALDRMADAVEDALETAEHGSPN